MILHSNSEALLGNFNVLLSRLQNAGVLEDFLFQYKMKESPQYINNEHHKHLISIISNMLSVMTKLKEQLLSEQEMFLANQAMIETPEEHSTEITVPPIEKHPKLVQIRVDRKEINRRIDAFISRKRKEVDEWNVQEFCSHPVIDEVNPEWEHQFSCARVDAVFVPRSGSKSHVKVSRVVNQWGPQTRLARGPSHNEFPNTSIKIKQENAEVKHTPDIPLGLEERLKNIESHLKLKSGCAYKDVLAYVKQLEDRILFLEGLSPEYFTTLQSTLRQQQQKPISIKEEHYMDWNLTEIDSRIQVLNDTLKQKSHKHDGPS